MVQQPKWDKYEAAILLDAVNAVNNGSETQKNAIIRVSRSLRQMALNRGIEIDETYRNANGIFFQFQSMENAAFGKIGSTNKIGTKLFLEIVRLSRDNPNEYLALLSHAKKMSETSNGNQNHTLDNMTSQKKSFAEWLGEIGYKDQTAQWIVTNYDKISSFAVKNKVSIVSLWDIGNEKHYNSFMDKLQNNKRFRILERPLYKFFQRNKKLYYDFLKVKSSLKRKEDDKVSDEIIQKQILVTKTDEELYKEYGNSFFRVFEILSKEAKHVFLTTNQIADQCNLSINDAEKILTEASWSERLGDGFILGCNVSAKKCLSFEVLNAFGAPNDVESIIMEHFRRGFRPSSIMDRNRFIALFEEKYNKEIDFDSVISEIQESCFLFDNRYFLPKALVIKETMQKIADYLTDFFNQNEILFYDVLYGKYMDDFGSNIYSTEMMVALLQKVLRGTSIYYFDRYCSVKIDAKPDVTTEVIDYLIQMDGPRSYDDIYHDLSHLNQNDIYNALHYNNPEVLGNSKTEYFHVKTAHINDSEQEEFRSIAGTLLNSSKYITCNEIMEKLSTRSPELMERLTAKFSTLGIRRILTYYLRSDFNVGTGIVTDKSIKLTVEDVFADFAKTHGCFTVDDVQRLSEYTGTVPYWEPIHNNAVRINSTDFIQPSDLDFDIEGIDAAIGYYCTDYISLSEISDYSRFPSCGTPWNIFLLQQYVFRFSDQFKLLSLGFSKCNASGVIARKQSGYPDFESVVIDALEKTKIVSPNDAMNFLCEKGFISERRYKKLADLLKIAIMRRNKD